MDMLVAFNDGRLRGIMQNERKFLYGFLGANWSDQD